MGQLSRVAEDRLMDNGLLSSEDLPSPIRSSFELAIQERAFHVFYQKAFRWQDQFAAALLQPVGDVFGGKAAGLDDETKGG